MSKHHRLPVIPMNGRRKPLGTPLKRNYFCTVVSEDVKIRLKKKPTSIFESKNELFVQCNQTECQYVDRNQSPCPLCLDLFIEEIVKQEKNPANKRIGFWNKRIIVGFTIQDIKKWCWSVIASGYLNFLILTILHIWINFMGETDGQDEIAIWTVISNFTCPHQKLYITPA